MSFGCLPLSARAETFLAFKEGQACRLVMEEKISTEKAESAVSVSATVGGASNQSCLRSFTKQSCWPLSTLSDLDERMQMVKLTIPQEDSADTFAERAESYYRQRPQLLALLQDLYHGYLSLADRYCQSLNKQAAHNRRRSSQTHFDYGDYEEDGGVDSDVESSLSFQIPGLVPSPQKQKGDGDKLVAELVMRSVDCDILAHELGVAEQQWGESSRKIELQKSLLEVLESERLILLDENARLGYRMAALVEENKAMAAESLFMKRKACELARCVLKMREDRRVCLLSRKIEDLQGQIFGLEKRNQEYYDQLVGRERRQSPLRGDEKKGRRTERKSRSGGEVTLVDCFQEYEDAECAAAAGGGGVGKLNNGADGGRKFFKWWDRVKNFDMFLCGPHASL